MYLLIMLTIIAVLESQRVLFSYTNAIYGPQFQGHEMYRNS
jgi:hypothetical protein